MLDFIDSSPKTVKMKSFIVALCVIGCAYAASPDATAGILRNEFEQLPDGGYHYLIETENKIRSEAVGQLKTIGDELAIAVQGSSQHPGPDGKLIQLTYVADENGFQPQGAHLPTPPPPEPIPAYIERALNYIKEHPYKGDN